MEGRSHKMASQICHQILSVFSQLPPSTSGTDPCDILVREFSAAAGSGHRIFVHGVGREGLMLRALCMRLFHLGVPTHVVGDVTTPPISSEDVLLCSAGPGRFSTVDAICSVARSSSARVVVLTARPDSGSYACGNADVVVHLPATTMAEEENEGFSSDAVRLPMGSAYEGAMYVLFEMVVVRLGEMLRKSPSELRSRHTNLE